MSQYKTVLTGFSVKDAESELQLWVAIWRHHLSQAKQEKSFLNALNVCDRNVLPLTFRLLRIEASQPSTTAAAERSFSALRRIKTWLRSTTGQDRLSGLALMYIHPELIPSADEIVTEFFARKRRRAR